MASVLWDEEVFENPREFNPDRFLNGDIAFKKTRSIPFGIGMVTTRTLHVKFYTPTHCLMIEWVYVVLVIVVSVNGGIIRYDKLIYNFMMNDAP